MELLFAKISEYGRSFGILWTIALKSRYKKRPQNYFEGAWYAVERSNLFFFLFLFFGKFLVFVLELIDTTSRIQKLGLTSIEGV